jgi:hypothetical protein
MNNVNVQTHNLAPLSVEEMEMVNGGTECRMNSYNHTISGSATVRVEHPVTITVSR